MVDFGCCDRGEIKSTPYLHLHQEFDNNIIHKKFDRKKSLNHAFNFPFGPELKFQTHCFLLKPSILLLLKVQKIANVKAIQSSTDQEKVVHPSSLAASRILGWQQEFDQVSRTCHHFDKKWMIFVFFRLTLFNYGVILSTFGHFWT